MDKPDAQAVAKLLRKFGQRSSLRGGNPYRAKAYARAADSLAALALPLDQLIAENRLQEIPGVGAATSSPSSITPARIQALKQCARKSLPACLKCFPCRACGRTRC
jgi:DNA polymerase/3'-5' exonuclease PolX